MVFNQYTGNKEITLRLNAEVFLKDRDMDEQKRQSIQFDVNQLEIELKRIENEIEFKEGELKFVRSGTIGVGATGMGIGALILKQAKSIHPIGKAVAIGSFIAGAGKGYDYSDSALRSEEAKIFNLKQERDRLINIICDRKKKLD